ncbi:arsenite methyltransferase [Gaoshiqia sediminis]|uniref:Arsenite methyltransferase n=1 Tax=Gaoshiqia sediminis TaxID=2986998 RepID=A0AA41YA95_9BACT|nr:arsenite methyltransferase [Gaoshiqia sediminis]MCW0484207.1 arsenite methyltransferase [Gaoshiqia sediminis]
MKADELKLIVQEKYGEIANQGVLTSNSSCCGPSSCCGEFGFSMIGDDYQQVAGYAPEADLGLGCGLPTEYAGIEKGHRVLDLGCGAGNDCFVARALVGAEGQVTGLDFTEAMLKKARQNNEKLGYKNVVFVQGDIEKMPLPSDSFDVVISNCVLNLVPDKQKAFGEIFRILVPGGHFCISDVVLDGELPAGLKEAAVMYAGCVSGALQKEEYLNLIEQQGFSTIAIHKQKQIILPEEILKNYLSPEEVQVFIQSGTGIYSITVTAKK